MLEGKEKEEEVGVGREVEGDWCRKRRSNRSWSWRSLVMQVSEVVVLLVLARMVVMVLSW